MNQMDKLRIEVATLEERVKDLRFELNDKNITIAGLEREVTRLRGVQQ